MTGPHHLRMNAADPEMDRLHRLRRLIGAAMAGKPTSGAVQTAIEPTIPRRIGFILAIDQVSAAGHN